MRVLINIIQKDVARVPGAIKAAKECKQVAAGSGHVIAEYLHKGDLRIIKYRFGWYLRDYEVRNARRGEVFTTISESLPSKEIAGTEVTLT